MPTMTERDLLERGYVIVGNRAVKREQAPATPATPVELSPCFQPAIRVEKCDMPPQANKYGAKPTLGPAPWGGAVRYPSQGHAAYARRCAAEKAAGLIVAWATEVSFEIGVGPRGKRRHKVDFAKWTPDGQLELVEVKGFDHGDGKNRRADLEAMGWRVEVVR